MSLDEISLKAGRKLDFRGIPWHSRGTMLIPVHRTASTKIKAKDQPLLTLAMRSVLAACTDLEQSTTFLSRNFITAFDKGSLKSALHEHQNRAVLSMDQAVGRLREKRVGKACEGIDRRIEEARLSGASPGEIAGLEGLRRGLATEALGKLPGRLGEGGDGFGNGFGPALACHVSVMDEAYRTLASREGLLLQKRIPAAMATGCREQVQERFSAWRKSSAEYLLHPEKYRGRPEMPGYRGEGERAVARVQAAALGELLPDISGKALFEDEACKVPLRKEAVDAWNGFEVGKAVEALRRRLLRDKSSKKKSKGRTKPRSLQAGRFVQLRMKQEADGIRLEAVFECRAEAPDASPLAIFAGPYLEGLREQAAARQDGKKARKDGVPKFKAFDLEALNDEALAFAKGHGPEPLRTTAGLDLGMANAATLAYGSGHASSVVSGLSLEAALRPLDFEIDRLASEKTPQRLKDLRSHRDKLKAADPEARLEKPLLQELKRLEAALARDPEIAKARARRRSLRSDLTHRLSAAIVGLLVDRGIRTLVVGKNDLWKTGADMGAAQNRRFHRIAHAELIGLLRWKCLEAGILVAACEESWTSKISFAANEAFPKPPKKNAKAKASKPPTAARPQKAKTPFDKKQPDPSAPAAASRDEPHGESRPALAGARKRDPQSRRNNPPQNLFETPGHGRWSRIHADSNGSYNIVRKACPGFRAHNGLSSAFELLWLSPRGLAPFKIGAGKKFLPI